MGIVDIVASCVLMAVTIGFVVMAIRKLVKNDRGYRQMEADRTAKGQPYFGQDDEELEKEMGIDRFI